MTTLVNMMVRSGVGLREASGVRVSCPLIFC
jgi:hypothetical protein